MFKLRHNPVFKTEIWPLESVPEATDDRRPVGACDWFPHGATDVMEDVITALHRHLHPGGAFDWIQGPGRHSKVLDAHVMLPKEDQLHLQLTSSL